MTIGMQKLFRMEKISVVILSFNRRQELESNLRLLLENPISKDFQIIVVDASSDGSDKMVENLASERSNLMLVRPPRDLGLVGRNEGYKRSTGDYIVSLDDDTQISADAIQKVPELFKRYPRAGLITFRMKHPVLGIWENPHGETACEVATVHGAGYAFPKSFLNTVGCLDEKCFWGGEELDYSIRCHAAGLRTIYVPEIVAFHNSKKRSGANGNKKLLFGIYNYTRVLNKHFPRRMALLFSIRYAVPRIISGVCSFNLLFPIYALTAILRGIREGVAEYKPVPEATIQYYASPITKPEFGNVPLTFKLFRKLMRK